MIDVSIIIPAYNAAQYICDAVESALSQNVSKEIIVVDDASTDNTESVLSKYRVDNRIIYVKNTENIGVAKSRNLGTSLAKGKYIAFLDSDDSWLEGKLKYQIDYMEKKHYMVSGTARKLIYEKSERKSKIIPVESEITYNKLLFHNALVCSSIVVKRELVLKVPMEHEEIHEDYLTWLRMLKICHVAGGINIPYVNYRMTNEGKSRNHIKSAKMTYGVYRILGYSRIKSFVFLLSHLINGIKKYS